MSLHFDHALSIIKLWKDGLHLKEQNEMIRNGRIDENARLRLLDKLFNSCEQLQSIKTSADLYDQIVNVIQDATLSARAGLFYREEKDSSWDRIAGSLNAYQVNRMSMSVVIDQHSGQLAFIVERATDASPFTPEDRNTFTILANLAGTLVENNRLYEERARYARQIEETQQALGQAEKLAAVGRLMASIAHEVNNPLQAVGTCLDLASRKELPYKKKQEYLWLAKTELERLGQTVQRMLEFYRPGTIERLPISINPLIERVINLVQQKLVEQEIQVHLQLSSDLPRVVAASDLILQVFFNLVVNAIEAMPDGGDLWIISEKDGNEVAIQFEDSGPGIPKEKRERLFEPFSSTKPGGSGLGLSVSYGIIEAHGGHLRLADDQSRWFRKSNERDKNRGTCFEVRLPREKKGPSPIQDLPPQGGQPPDNAF